MRKYYRDFSGGMIDKIEPELIPDNAVVKAINCEYVKSGVLTKRRGTMPSDLQSGLANQGLLNPRDFWVWYPKTMPTGSIGSVVYVVYTNDYRMCVLWKTSETLWSHQETDFTYTEDSEIEIFAGADSFLITDNVNIAHRIVIDNDGTILSGYLEIPAPPEAPILRPFVNFFNVMEDWDANRFETDSSGEKVGDCGLVQCVVTVVTEYGEESNPSPISKTLDMQWFKIDTDNIDEQWLDKVYTDNLTIPEGIDEYTRSKLKYFKIYYRIFRYSDLESQPFTLGATIEISDKTAGAKNTYTLTNLIGSGEYPSYENDSAPIGKVICETADVKFIGGVKTNLKFPHSDLKYCKLNIQNPDSRSYVDAPIRIRFYDRYADVPNNKKISDFVFNGYWIDKIRIYDRDVITPIQSIYRSWNINEHYVEAIVKIPLFAGGINNSIYFCFRDESIDNSDDGEMITPPLNWDRQKVFQNEKVKYRSVLCCPNIEFQTDKWYNKANINSNGIMGSSTGWVNNSISKIPCLNNFSMDPAVGNKHIKIDNGTIIFEDISITSIPERGYIYGRLETSASYWQGVSEGVFKQICYTYNDADQYIMTMKRKITGEPCPTIILTGGNGEDFDNIEIPLDTPVLIAYSWNNKDKKQSAFLINLETNTVIYETITTSYELEQDRITKFYFSNVIDDLKLAEWQMISGKYLDFETEQHRNAMINCANFMPAYESSMVGHNHITGESNENITFEETKENDIKERKNAYKWSELNGINFPDLFEKQVREPILKIIPTQSYLQFEYLPTVLIFTRNTVTRFIVSGLPEDWRQQSDKLIEEYSQYGLLAPKSLTKVGNSLFWFSEIGVIMWDNNGFRNISIEKIDIPIADTYIGFYTKRNQYILQQITPGLNYSYVYDITRNVWTKFYGLDVQVAQILAGGTESDNINLFLNSQGVIEAYPDESHYTELETIITTKKYVFDNVKYRRFRMDYEGNISHMLITIINRNNNIYQYITSVSRMKMNGLANGSWGESIQFVIKDSDKFKRLDLDILPRG